MIHNTSLSFLVQIILSLGWQDVTVFRDDTAASDTVFWLANGTNGITFVEYDITFSSDEHLLTILDEIHHVTRSGLQLLLLCDHLLTVRVLQQMDHFNNVVTSPFDVRHASRILTLGDQIGMNSIMATNTQVENIALVEYQGNSSTPTLWTLVFSQNGRMFTTVSVVRCPELEVKTVFPNTQYGYNGRQVTVIMKPYTYPYGFINIAGMRVHRVFYRTLEYLAQNLNFSPNVIPSESNEWGINIQGSWTGVVGMLQRKEADLLANTLTLTWERETVIDHVLPPLMENRMMILYKQEDEDEDHLMAYLHPFQPAVYLYCTVSLFVYSFLLCFTCHVNEGTSHTLQYNRNIPVIHRLCRTFISEFLHSSSAAVRQGTRRTVSRDSKRLLVSSWWIFTTMISSVYSGAILASLAIKIQKPPFSNLAELAERRDYKIGYDASTVIATYLENSNDVNAVSIRNRVRDLAAMDPDVLSSNLTKHFEKIQEGKYAFLAPVIPAMYQNRINCRLKAIDSKIGTSYFCFAVPKHSPYKKTFENSIYQLQDNGILQKILDEWLSSIPEDKCPVTAYPRPISLVQLQSIFIAVGVGVCASLIVLCGEAVRNVIYSRN